MPIKPTTISAASEMANRSAWVAAQGDHDPAHGAGVDRADPAGSVGEHRCLDRGGWQVAFGMVDQIVRAAQGGDHGREPFGGGAGCQRLVQAGAGCAAIGGQAGGHQQGLGQRLGDRP